MNFAAIGWPTFFNAALPIYQAPAATEGPLPLATILNTIQTMLHRESPAERRRIWRATGAYVAANAWQLAFRLDLRHPASSGARHTPWLDRYDRHLAPLVNSPAGQRLAQLLTWCWFQLVRRRAATPRRHSGRTTPPTCRLP